MALDNMDPTTAFLIAAGSGLMGTRGPGGFGRAGMMGLESMDRARRTAVLEAESRQRELERQSAEQMRALQMKQIEAALKEAESSRARREAWMNTVTGGMRSRADAAEQAAQPPSLGPVDPQADVANILRSAQITNDRARAAQRSTALPYTYEQGLQAEMLGIDPKATDRLKEMAIGWEMKPGAPYYNPRTSQVAFTADPKEGTRMSPDGRLEEIPGAVDLASRRAGAVAGAEARAKAGFDFIEMLDQRPGSPTFGKVIQVPKSELSGSAPKPAMPAGQASPGDRYRAAVDLVTYLREQVASEQNPTRRQSMQQELAVAENDLRRLGNGPQGAPQPVPVGSPQPAPSAASGGLVSPKQAELDAAAAKAAGRVEQAKVTTDNVKSAIDDALSLVGITSTGAIGAAMRQLPAATDAGALDNAVKSVQANLSFGALQQMRENSPTGGALGQVAIQELEMLKSTVVALDPVRDGAERTRNKLLKIKQHYESWLDAANKGYQKQYGKPMPPIDLSGPDIGALRRKYGLN